MELLRGVFPNRGLKFPKGTERPPFQTQGEIERQIALGELTDLEQRELWDCLFLTRPEIDELLLDVKRRARHAFLYPMFCFAAHTGARRSEMLRLRWHDIDFERETVVLHERKRSKEKRTSRRVRLSPFLLQVLKEWKTDHPGGPFVFCLALQVDRSKKERTEIGALTRNEANDHFKRTVSGSKCGRLRGWHVFRHSFVSNCAAAGIDVIVI
jgi:integrase